MGADSKIEWTDHTFNPWWGCTKVAAGCTNCYAEGQSKRYGHDVWGKDAPRRFLSDNHWKQPLKWAKDAVPAQGQPAIDLWEKTYKRKFPRPRVFCGSMCDVFEDRPDLVAPRTHLLELIRDTPGIDWLLLTKRPERVVPLLERSAFMDERRYLRDLPPNVWLGVSIAEQKDADRNIPALLSIPAAVRFVSLEPQIESVCLREWLSPWKTKTEPSVLLRDGIDWVIQGGESGPSARPFDVAWARDVRDQCKAAGVAYFLKQLGAKANNGRGCDLGPFKDRKGGDPSEWPEDLRDCRAFPEAHQ